MSSTLRVGVALYMILILFLISLTLVTVCTGAACYMWAELVLRIYEIRSNTQLDVTRAPFWSLVVLTLGGWVIIVVGVCLALILVMGAFAA